MLIDDVWRPLLFLINAFLNDCPYPVVYRIEVCCDWPPPPTWIYVINDVIRRQGRSRTSFTAFRWLRNLMKLALDRPCTKRSSINAEHGAGQKPRRTDVAAWGRTLCTKFGQLVLMKIIKIVATRCKILRLKCTKFDFRWGSAPDPAGGAYSAPPDPLAVFKRAYF